MAGRCYALLIPQALSPIWHHCAPCSLLIPLRSYCAVPPAAASLVSTLLIPALCASISWPGVPLDRHRSRLLPPLLAALQYPGHAQLPGARLHTAAPAPGSRRFPPPFSTPPTPNQPLPVAPAAAVPPGARLHTAAPAPGSRRFPPPFSTPPTPNQRSAARRSCGRGTAWCSAACRPSSPRLQPPPAAFQHPAHLKTPYLQLVWYHPHRCMPLLVSAAPLVGTRLPPFPPPAPAGPRRPPAARPPQNTLPTACMAPPPPLPATFATCGASRRHRDPAAPAPGYRRFPPPSSTPPTPKHSTWGLCGTMSTAARCFCGRRSPS
ncbi:hypothetical protein C8F04DRAFT_1264269 [Mycena alexandri]|uniref:Uncharacterized protein n=1 Tax=Mycena alexandri TaxID=1745969 RepID=A0AAD6SM94_9AGAR|nr:hypothetical protein C8F04DRAFT_1264269 [Mycena alexandri]